MKRTLTVLAVVLLTSVALSACAEEWPQLPRPGDLRGVCGFWTPDFLPMDPTVLGPWVVVPWVLPGPVFVPDPKPPVVVNGRPLCPRCGSCNTVPIIYGYAPDLVEAWKAGKVELGGCVIDVENPNWHCKTCGNDFESTAVEPEPPVPTGTDLWAQFLLD